VSIAYCSITILTNEEARWKGRPLHDAVVNLVRGRKIAVRRHVTRGIAGCYENGEVATHSIVDLSANLPLEIRIVLPAAEVETLLSDLEPMVSEGRRRHDPRRDGELVCHLGGRSPSVRPLVSSLGSRRTLESTPLG